MCCAHIAPCGLLHSSVETTCSFSTECPELSRWGGGGHDVCVFSTLCSLCVEIPVSTALYLVADLVGRVERALRSVSLAGVPWWTKVAARLFFLCVFLFVVAPFGRRRVVKCVMNFLAGV